MNNKTVHFLLFLLFGVTFSSAQKATEKTVKPTLSSKSFENTIDALNKETIPYISVQELYENKDQYILFDAREINEYKVSHIEKAKYIGYDNWQEKALEGIDKSKAIVVYCSIGVRSEDIAEKLKSKGYTNVQNLYGSIFEWANQGYPLVDNAGYPTMKVHGYSWLWGKWMTNPDFEKVY